MKTLALELSSPRGSVAWRENEVVFVQEFANDRKHSGVFFETVEACLRQFGNPDHIAVGLGPGSYAGTRIAISAALGLHAATGATMSGISSLLGIPGEDLDYVVVGDARRQSFFFAAVHERRFRDGPLLCSRSELEERLQRLTCEVFSSEPISGFPDLKIAHPSAAVLAGIDVEVIPEEPLEPIYLREPHITLPNAAARPSVQTQ